MISALENAIELSAARNTVGVIGMQVRHQYDIDALGLDAGGDEIGDGAADCSLARLKKRTAKPAVDQHQL